MKNSLLSTLFLFGLSLRGQTLVINPNPCDQRTLASFSLTNSDTVTLQVFNVSGQLVKSLYFNSYLTAGMYQDSIFLNSSPPGIYMVFFKTNLGGSKGYKIIKQGLVGIKQYTKSESLNIYPNPVTDFLTIQTNGFEVENVTFTLINPLGQMLYFKQYNPPENKIDFRGLSNGVYFLKISSVSGQNIMRIIKE